MTRASDRQLAELYAAPLAEFTRTRDRLARQLRAAGDREQAAEVARLRRPSAALWAVNQVARRDPASLGRFIDAVSRLKRAQMRRTDDVGPATAAQRAALTALLARAEEILESTATKPSPAQTQRVSNTLLGAATDRRLEADLRAGRLATEQDAPGFEVLAGTHLRAIPNRAGETVERKDASTAARGREVRAATRRARQAERAKARETARRLRALDRVAARHRRAAEAGAARADRLGRELQAQQQLVARARAAADAAAREAQMLRASRGGP